MHTLIVAIHAIVIFHRSSANSCLLSNFAVNVPAARVTSRGLSSALLSTPCKQARLAFELVISLQRCIGSAAHHRGWRVSSRRDERRGPSSGLENEAKAEVGNRGSETAQTQSVCCAACLARWSSRPT